MIKHCSPQTESPAFELYKTQLLQACIQSAGKLSTPGPVYVEIRDTAGIGTYVSAARVEAPFPRTDKFPKIRILHVDGPFEAKFTLRNTAHISLTLVDMLNGARAYLPDLIHTSSDWAAFEYLEGSSDGDFVNCVSASDELCDHVARQAAQMLHDFAKDGLSLMDTMFSRGHNVLLTHDQKLRFYDWDAFFDESKSSAAQILFDWIEQHLYHDVYKSDSTRPQPFAEKIYLLICKYLFEVCPELANVGKPYSKTVHFRPAHPLYSQKMLEYKSGNNPNLTAKIFGYNKDTILIETIMGKHKVNQNFLRIMATEDYIGFGEYIRTHVNPLNEKIYLF